ncbi:MAG: sialate O-acetylesterase [Akkermansiaceae bacterium]|nr:sialate O-acetylesterase [Akkermansiaceae bacterium]
MAVYTLLTAFALATEDERDPNDWQIPPAKKEFHLFLLMGQSNMSGGVKIAAGDTQPAPHVLKMLHAREGQEAKWVPGAYPLHPRRPNKKKMHGPGPSFAQTYLADKAGIVVGLIPMAWGGRNIARLEKGSVIYNDDIRHAKAAMQAGTLKSVPKRWIVE